MASHSQSNPKAQRGRKSPSKTSQPKAGQRSDSRGRTDRPRSEDRNVLERGDLFFYRPADEATPPEGLLDINRFHMVLRPEGRETLRYITVGKKKLPGDGGDNRHWGFVDGVFRKPEDLREALAGTEEGDNRGRAAARPAGEGVYALVRSGRNTMLAYALELPESPGEVQETLGIAAKGRFVLIVKNPEANAPVGVGLDEDRKAEFPEDLQRRFDDRKWIGADPPEFLDHRGAELILIAGDERGDDLGIDLEPQPEDEESAEVFRDLHLEKSERTIRPLFEGTWE